MKRTGVFLTPPLCGGDANAGGAIVTSHFLQERKRFSLTMQSVTSPPVSVRCV